MSGNPRTPKPSPIVDRIETVLRYGMDPACEVVTPARAVVFACQLVIEEDMLRPRPCIAFAEAAA